MVQEISKSLQRYYDNRQEINERQKKYFKEVWYRNNRQKCLHYQRLIREGRKGRSYHILDKSYLTFTIPDTVIERNCTVTFD
jgi:hypothetical protein